MIKNIAFRKLLVTSIALLTIGVIYFFPNNKNIKFKEIINYYEEDNLKSVYLMDKYNYVSKLKVPIYETDILEMIKEKLNYLIIDSESKDKIPNGFRGLIPINTKILDLKLDNNILIINFSKEFLNTNKDDEEHMIEAIVFTMTEFESIKGIKIKVEGIPLLEFPISKKKIPEVLDRTFGINKVYNFSSLNNLNQTIIYYVNKINDKTYYTPVTKINNDSRDKVTLVIEELKSNIIYQTNLSSYLSEAAILDKYEIEGDKIILLFNDKIFDTNSKNILEEVEYTISMSLMDNLGVKEVVFRVNDEKNDVSVIKTLEN